MRLRYARITTAGPIREINEDYLDFWESEDPLVREQKGSVALLADGVGGLDRGELLAPAGKVADHRDQAGAESAGAGGHAAAAGRRLVRGSVIEVDLQRFGAVDGGSVAHVYLRVQAGTAGGRPGAGGAAIPLRASPAGQVLRTGR